MKKPVCVTGFFLAARRLLRLPCVLVMHRLAVLVSTICGTVTALIAICTARAIGIGHALTAHMPGGTTARTTALGLCGNRNRQ